jgi:hypothetical protein
MIEKDRQEEYRQKDRSVDVCGARHKTVECKPVHAVRG